MKVLVYADFRSPHARGWRQGLVAAGMDVLAVSSEPVDDLSIVSPSDSVSLARQNYVKSGTNKTSRFRTLVRKVSALQLVHSLIQLLRSKSRTRDLVRNVVSFKPDVVHALRLPYEGVTALASRLPVPVIVSSWGLDFVPQASSDPLLRFWLRKYLPTAAAFQYDSPKDLVNARSYGLPDTTPSLFAAGNFGIDESLFYPSDEVVPGLVIYARKAMPNCNYFGFVEAAIQLLDTTDATFVGIGLDKIEDEVVRRFGDYDHDRLRLIGEVDMVEFARLIRTAHVVVSPSYWDGMPVTILDAAASGARIVAGDLPQLRELVNLGVDMMLIDASETAAIAEGIESQLGATSVTRTATLPEVYDRAKNTVRVSELYSAALARDELRT